jgi:hypothetical protein
MAMQYTGHPTNSRTGTQAHRGQSSRMCRLNLCHEATASAVTSFGLAPMDPLSSGEISCHALARSTARKSCFTRPAIRIGYDGIVRPLRALWFGGFFSLASHVAAGPARFRFEPTDLRLEPKGVAELDVQIGTTHGEGTSGNRVILPDFEFDLGLTRGDGPRA